jgi:hypothetical protein
MISFWTSSYFWEVLCSLLLFSVVLSAALSLVLIMVTTKTERRKLFRASLLLLVTMSVLGAIIGYLTGISRAPAVGNVLPAALTLVGGLLLYMFGKESQGGRQQVAAVSTFALVIGLLTGTLLGAEIRADDSLVTALALQQESAREAVCTQRLAYEIQMRDDRARAKFAELNPTLAIPGCLPPQLFKVDKESASEGSTSTDK